MARKISNVLAANRGEIAVRIFRACTELGISTTAIYSHEDRLSIHRYKADRGYQIGKQGRPVEVYLDQEELIALAKRKAVDLLERFNLGEWVDKKCEALSKGMGQKVQILGTIIHEPELVILDEPFSGLDPVNIELMRDLILDLDGGRSRGLDVPDGACQVDGIAEPDPTVMVRVVRSPLGAGCQTPLSPFRRVGP